MSKSLLSIFNFETIDINSFPRHFFYSIFLCCFCLVLIESVSRILLAPIGEYAWAYWTPEAINKFEWYRQISDEGTPPEVLTIGDSTAARNFDPYSFSKITGRTSYNMGWPANFPKALQVTTYPLIENSTPPQTIFLIQSPKSYVNDPRTIRFENSILSSQIAKHYSQDYLITDYIYLSRLYKARFLLKKFWVHHQKIVTEPDLMGFMPVEAATKEPVQPGIKSKGKPQTYSLSRDRLNCFVQLATILKRRNVQFIVVIPPTNSDSIPTIYKDYIIWLESISSKFAFSVWDFSRSDLLHDEHFFDRGHLNESGARVFSLELGRRFKEIKTRKDI